MYLKLEKFVQIYKSEQKSGLCLLYKQFNRNEKYVAFTLF